MRNVASWKSYFIFELLKYIKNRKVILNYNNILQNYFYFVFDQINAALHFKKKILQNHDDSNLLTGRMYVYIIQR